MKELTLLNVDQLYLHYFISYHYYQDQVRRDSLGTKGGPTVDDLKKLQEANGPVSYERKAIPIFVSRLEKITLQRCFMDLINYK